MPSPGRFPAPSEDDIQEATNETSTARTKRPKYSHETLLDELTNIDFDQRNLHRVVLNYLNTNMCKDTYVNFLRESGFIGGCISWYINTCVHTMFLVHKSIENLGLQVDSTAYIRYIALWDIFVHNCC
uniref:LisH domain-containing protein n=1 Tax=Babesia bovis TaxID=5865 RepID=S6B0Y8_BABBO|nr:conserved hypothetical protein [Babesia bovis]